MPALSFSPVSQDSRVEPSALSIFTTILTFTLSVPGLLRRTANFGWLLSLGFALALS